MKTSVFHIPLIVDLIAQHLHAWDLFSCVLVSKDWHASFTPRLWRSIVFKEDIPGGALIQHQEYVRSIVGNGGYISRSTSIGFKPLNLQTLKFNSEDHRDISKVLLRMAKQATFLRSLDMLVLTKKPYYEGALLSALESHHPTLREFRLKCPKYPFRGILQLIHACRHLECLSIEAIALFDETNNMEYESALTKEFFRDIGDMQCKDISISVDCSLELDVILGILDHTPLLERLGLLTTLTENEGASVRQIAQVLRSKHRSKLKHLSLDIETDDDSAVVQLLAAVGYDGANHDGQINNEGGLLSLHLSLGTSDAERLCEFVPRYFATSLVNLDLFSYCSTPNGIEIIGNILSGLPNLLSLKVGLFMDLVDIQVFDIDAIYQKSWKCVGLRKMSLEVGGYTNPPKKDDLALDYILSRIAQLPMLEELSIEIGTPVLAKECGYLNYLVGLKRLKVLDLSKYKANLSIKDVEWMLLHWTSLDCLIMNEYQISKPKAGSRRSKNPIVQLIRSKRPSIRVIMDGAEL
ncbi:hypothetical protein BGX21_007798 [Mortierella sp. AD011]|nr:hypothetical protein BGX20_006676 [Mortierella sp. AD010]KAF9398436.1 hypothetical protein BGX21_007798 [Mortierella sp. AD011]